MEELLECSEEHRRGRLHTCPQASRIAFLEAKMENAVKALDRGINRFEKTDDTLKEIQDSLQKIALFQERQKGGYRFFMGILTVLGAFVGLFSYFLPQK